MPRKVAGKSGMQSLLACNVKCVFLYWTEQNKEVTNMAFAEKLKSIRKQAGMSKEQLAEKLGISRQVDNEVK